MTATAEPIFDATQYDLEGTPTLNGRKAGTITLAFDPYELDHTDADHMLLAGQLEPGQNVTLTVVATIARRAWSEKPNDNGDTIAVTYRADITDIHAA